MAIALAFPRGISPKANNPIAVTGTGPTVARVRVFTPGSGDDSEEEDDDGGRKTDPTFRACHTGITCLEIDFNAGSFTAGSTFSFNVNFTKKVTVGQLTGTHHTVVTDDLLATTSILEPFVGSSTSTSAAVVNNQPLTANSQFPDATVPAIIVNPARFAAFGAPPSFTGFGLRACTVSTESSGGDELCPQPVLPQGE
jgi:hypothetical protein